MLRTDAGAGVLAVILLVIGAPTFGAAFFMPRKQTLA
jgi:hypothetical protein